MPNCYIHYVRREIVDGLSSSGREWLKCDQPEIPAFERPDYHTTRATNGPAAQVQRGDVIWLVGQLFSPWGSLPPSLDARIEVAEVRRRSDGEGYHFSAGKNSRWFPLADASQILRSNLLETVAVNNKVQQLWLTHRPIGHSLQRMRKLVSDALLQCWVRELDERGFNFISYRLRDGTHSAFLAARAEIEQGNAIFWDRWCLPRRVAEGREFVADEKLEALINTLIAEANNVFGISSPLYGEDGSYSIRERDYAESLGKFSHYTCFDSCG